MKRRFSDLQTREVLALAIDVERNNAARFETVRDFFAYQEKAIYELFESLRQDEVQHLKTLEEAARRLFPEGLPPIAEENVAEVVECVDVDDGEHAIFNAITRRDALLMALRAERNAKELYRRAAAGAQDPSLRQVYEYVLALEGDHEQHLLDLLYGEERRSG